MNTNKLTLLVVIAVSLLSCKEEELTIHGQVKEYLPLVNESMLEPVANLPISIYLSNEANMNVPISQQKHLFNCKTDKNGYYKFNIKEVDQHSLDRHNAYLIKSAAFDSTKVEWQYLCDSTLAKAFDVPLSINFSHAIGHSLNPGHGFRLVPAGWVYFKLENLNYSSIRISNGHNFTLYYKENGNANTSFLFLPPSKVNEIKIQDNQNLETGTLGIINLFVRNSFVRSSRPWNESLRPDTVIVDMNTMKYRVIKAQLD